MAKKYIICKSCQEGKHGYCESPLAGGRDCSCIHPDCIWMRNEGNVN